MSVILERDTDDDKDEFDASERVVGTTQGGKDIVIYWDNSGYCKVKFTSGGILPARLRGRFTRYEIAEDFVKAYLASEGEYLRQEALKRAEQEAIEADRQAHIRAVEAEQNELIRQMEERAEANIAKAEALEVKSPAKKTTKKVVKKDAESSSES